MSKKCSNAEIEARVGEVLDLVLTGSTRSEIVRYGSKQGWGVSSRQIDDYIADARAEIAEINKITATETMEMIVRNMWMLFKRCIAKDDFQTAKGILVDIAKFKGLAQETITHIIRQPKEDLAILDDDKFDQLSMDPH